MRPICDLGTGHCRQLESLDAGVSTRLRRPPTMDLLTLLLLSTALAPVSASPIALPGAQRHAAHASQGSKPLPLAVSTAASGHTLSPPPTPTPAPPTRGGKGAPMKPIRNRRDGIIMDSGVVDLWPASDVHTVVLGPLPTTGACTTTIIEQIWDPCFWDGTTTIYPATTTLLQPIDCGLCDDVYVPKAIYFCPNQKINGTRRMSVPSTSWSTVCAPATTTPSAAGVNQPATTTDTTTSRAARTPAAVPVVPVVAERAPFAVAAKPAPTAPAVAERAPFAVAAKPAPTVAERAPFAVAAKPAPTAPAVAERAPFAVAAKPAPTGPTVAERAPFAVAAKPAAPTAASVGSRSPKPPARIQAAAAPACPTTLVVQPEKSAGKTSTRYATYTTTTVTVDCSGCSLVISTALAGFGPPFSFATTTTVSVGAATTWACR